MTAQVIPFETDNLPSLLTRAANRLLEAKTSAEVLEAKKIAELALHLAKVTKAANETHGDCLRIITRAESKMADEIDAGQDRGEIATKEEGVRGPDTSTLDDIGVSRQRLSEWREVRDAGEDVVEEAIENALAEGRPPTKADIRNHVRGTFGTGENEWYTPAQYIELARCVLEEFDVDPASNEIAQKTVNAKQFYTKDDDGLTKEWLGRVWLNPPYAQPHITNFADKMVAEVDSGNVSQAIMLTHNYTDTQWFHKLAEKANAICFTRGRIRFESPTGELAAPTQGQAFFYFGNRVEAFQTAFSGVGIVVVPCA